MSFAESFASGQIGENAIARWCRRRGNCVLPVYEKEIDTGKGPRLFAPDGEYAAPDMFLMPTMRWVEAKTKSVFTWHRLTRRWCTGIDENHYHDYLAVQERSRQPVWVFFLHRSDVPDPRDIAAGCPEKCPTGLFANTLSYLQRNINHRHQNGGRHGMIYWAHEKLYLREKLDDLDLST